MNNLFNPGGVNNLANQFLKWLIYIGAVVGAIGTINDSSFVSEILEWKNFEVAISFVQLFFALIILTLGEPTKIGWDAKLNDKKIEASIKAFPDISREIWEKSLVVLKTQFSKWWMRLWASWALFYLYLSITQALKNHFNAQDNSSIVIGINIYTIDYVIGNCLNLMSSFCLMRLYFILMYKAVSHSSKDNPDYDNHEKDVNIIYRRKVSATALFFLFVIVTELFSYFAIALIDKDAADTNGKLLFQKTITQYFQIINGVFASVSLAFFVSRLFGSVTTKIPLKNQFVLPALFTYCAIQPFYPVIVAHKQDGVALKIFILLVALMGKYILNIATIYLFQNKFILYYLARTTQLQNQVDKESKFFSQIWNQNNSKETSSDKTEGH